MTNKLSDAGLGLDEVHSFVLRVSIDRAHGGHGTPRPQFQLEHVNSQTTWRTRTLREAYANIEGQVRAIFEQLGLAGVADTARKPRPRGRSHAVPAGTDRSTPK